MGQSILAIDDSQEIHQLLDARLRPDGLTVHHAVDAEDGIRKARDLQPDLILLDVEMPTLSGFEVCQRLKADPTTSSLQVILLGAIDQSAKAHGFDLGAVDCLAKPLHAGELRARVRAALRTKRCHDLLASRAQIDGLTGLWNRSYFNQRLNEEVAAGQRYGRMVCLVLMDLDGFARLNESYGRPFGDQVLQSVGELLAGSLRVTDAPCRYGGDELAMILTETDMEDGLLVSRRVQRQLGGLQLQPRGKPVSITASFGVASSDLCDEPRQLSVPLLIAAAEEALLSAKHAGHDQISRATFAIDDSLR